MWFLALFSLCFSLTTQASIQIKSQIHDIDYGQSDEDIMLLLKSGDVAWMKKKAAKSLSKIIINRKETFNFILNDQRELMRLEVIPQNFVKTHETLPGQTTEEIYTPTIVSGLDLAKEYFNEARYLNKESQCYNRAHVWSYEWFTNRSVNSNKTWVFFTRRYIRKFKFEWWFHVSPSIAVMEVDGVVREKIMDVKYGRGPMPLKQWTDIFMRDDAHCPKVETYSDYANYPESGSCYTMRSSMFYYQPFDVETKETWGTVKANWFESELKQAYLEAFDEEI